MYRYCSHKRYDEHELLTIPVSSKVIKNGKKIYTNLLDFVNIELLLSQRCVYWIELERIRLYLIFFCELYALFYDFFL